MNVLAYVHLRNIYRSTGAGRVARELIEHVSRRDGIDMHILADKADHQSVAHKVGGPWTRFPYHFFDSDTSTQQAKWLVLQRPAAASYWPEAEVTHCTTESYVPKANSRLIVTIHDAAYFDGAHPRCFATYKQQLKWKLLYGALARYTDVFHTVSAFSAERLAQAFPMIRSRLRVIHNAVSGLFFESGPPQTRELLQSYGVGDRPYVLLPGGLHYRKNAEMVLRAWPIFQNRFPDAVLIISGHNSPEYVARAKALGSSVVLAGFVEDTELRALYCGAHVVWFPTHYEGFGIPVLEAMACGGPIVASDNTAIPEVAGDAAILVAPHALEQHVEALTALMRDHQLRASFSARGKRRAAPFTWDASAAKLHSLYAEIA